MKYKTLLLITPLLVLAPLAQAADDGQTLFVKKTCVACHGKDAKTPILPTYPKIAGQNAEYAYAQMNDIKTGARNNGQTAAMKGIMHLVSEEEMRTLADWLASQQ